MYYALENIVDTVLQIENEHLTYTVKSSELTVQMRDFVKNHKLYSSVMSRNRLLVLLVGRARRKMSPLPFPLPI